MSKLLCEYGERTKTRGIKCTLEENQGCKYIRYCTQDSYWWCSEKYYNCARRKSEMENKILENIDENIFSTNNVDKIDEEQTVEVLKNEDETISENIIDEIKVVEKKEEVILKKNNNVNKKSTLKRVIY